MIVYNVTIKVEHSIAHDWQVWMQQAHIPMLLQTNCFVDAKLFRLLEQDDTDGPTFCAQYYAPSRTQYDEYIDKYAAQMRAESQKLWGDKFIAFRSLMEQQA